MEPQAIALPLPREKTMWSRSHRMVISIFAAAVLLLLAVERKQNSAELSDPVSLSAARGQEVANRVDLNTADAAALAAIPSVGPSRASAIVAYRETKKRDASNCSARLSISDLIHIKGFGPSMLKNIRPFVLTQERTGGDENP